MSPLWVTCKVLEAAQGEAWSLAGGLRLPREGGVCTVWRAGQPRSLFDPLSLSLLLGNMEAMMGNWEVIAMVSHAHRD